MSTIPDDLQYTKEHEWIRNKDDVIIIGITDFAQSELGDIVFVELPEVGSVLRAGETFGTVESVKTVSDLYAPVSGTVVRVNASLQDAPEKVNEDPYGEGWMLEVERGGETSPLMSAASYSEHVSG